MEVDAKTSEWDAFYDDWRVHGLLRSSAELCPEAQPRGGSARSSLLHSADLVTGYVRRELLDAVRVQAFALDIQLHSVQAEVTVIPLVQASAEVPGNQPWIRYAISIGADATDQQLLQLHRRIQTTCVHRFEHEYETPIAGKLVDTRTADR